MSDLPFIASAAVELFRQHSPWLAEKLGAAAVSQAVKEVWEQLKKKLSSSGGKEAVQRVESQPEQDTHWEVLRSLLLDALEQDAVFRERLAGLVISQHLDQSITGDGNKQAAITGSPGSSIKL